MTADGAAGGDDTRPVERRAVSPQVHLDGEEPNGLAVLVAGLVEAAVAADAGRARLLETTRGAAQIDVPDAGVTVGLKLVPGALTVTSGPVPGSSVRIRADAETLLGLPAVPLRLGLPDPLSASGRSVLAQLATGRIRVRGLPFGLSLLRTVLRLLSVA